MERDGEENENEREMNVAIENMLKWDARSKRDKGTHTHCVTHIEGKKRSKKIAKRAEDKAKEMKWGSWTGLERDRANQIWDKQGIEFYRDLDNKANDSENCVLFAWYFVKFYECACIRCTKMRSDSLKFICNYSAVSVALSFIFVYREFAHMLTNENWHSSFCGEGLLCKVHACIINAMPQSHAHTLTLALRPLAK